MIYDVESLQTIRDILIGRKETVSVAESVTAGNLQTALSNAPDAACFLEGGITAYNLGQKTRLLAVEPIEAMASDCVSEKVTTQMARETSRLFLSDHSIAITGYATPVPEKNITELYAWICIMYKSQVLLSQKIIPGNNIAFDAQLSYTNTLLRLFAGILREQKHIQ